MAIERLVVWQDYEKKMPSLFEEIYRYVGAFLVAGRMPALRNAGRCALGCCSRFFSDNFFRDTDQHGNGLVANGSLRRHNLVFISNRFLDLYKSEVLLTGGQAIQA